MRAAHHDLSVAELRRRKILREPLIEPGLRPRVIRVQQHVRKVVQHWGIWIDGGDIERDELMVWPAQEKPGSSRGNTGILLDLNTIAKRDDLSEDRDVDRGALQ